jgi:homoserine kinase type II
MAVYTTLNATEIDQWLKNFSIGSLRAYQGISSGIENTNYFVTTDQNKFVLTLFERLTHQQLPFYLELMNHLASAGVPCPKPIAQHNGALLGTLKGKPAAMVNCLPGKAITAPNVQACNAVGTMLAQMHNSAASFKGALANQRGLDWWQATGPKVMPHLPNTLQSVLTDELKVQAEFGRSTEYEQLPRCAVHADLFRDNVLFDGPANNLVLGGAIDFYFAGVDTCVFDLAVTVNDWCIIETSGELDPVKFTAFMQAYQSTRALTALEKKSINLALRAAALRFWLSRLDDWYSPRPASELTPKDPAHFERLLQSRRLHPTTLVA